MPVPICCGLLRACIAAAALWGYNCCVRRRREPAGGALGAQGRGRACSASSARANPT